MSKSREIRDAIRRIAGKGHGDTLFLTGRVRSVEGDTCTVDMRGLSLDGVRLTAVNDGARGKLLLTPKTGSAVLLADLSGGELRDLAAVAFTALESVEATCTQITLNGGDNGGLVNIERLKEWMRNVENDMMSLKALLATSPIAGNGAVAGIVFSPATKSVAAKIEDKSIKH